MTGSDPTAEQQNAARANTAKTKAAQVTLAVFDVDGIMTDGRLFYSSQGSEIKAFNVKDGLGIKLLQKHSITTAIITGRSSPLLERRAKELGITNVIQGREDKLVALKELQATLGVPFEHIAYIGDDLPDLPAIKAVGFGATVVDGDAWVKQQADWITQKPGGSGAAREFCEFILDAKGLLQPYRERCLTQ